MSRWSGALAAVCVGVALSAAVRAEEPLPVVSVDLTRYAGTWYEIARLPNFFQRNCDRDVVAQYTPQPDGTVAVLNQCAEADGHRLSASGQARRVNQPGAPDAGQLEVRFAPAWLSWLPLVWGDYWVMGLDTSYRVALVGAPNRRYLWLLAREPQLPDAVVNHWLAQAEAEGFPTDQVVRTRQSSALSRPH